MKSTHHNLVRSIYCFCTTNSLKPNFSFTIMTEKNSKSLHLCFKKMKNEIVN